MLSPDVTNAIRAFMSRVQLSGQEVPAYNNVMMALALNDAEFRAEAQKSEQRKYQEEPPPAVPPGNEGAQTH